MKIAMEEGIHLLMYLLSLENFLQHKINLLFNAARKNLKKIAKASRSFTRLQ